MLWDQETPFVIDIEVYKDDIDELGHVNNTVYVKWLEKCAWQHSNLLGLTLGIYQSLDRAMAVIRHEIDYLAGAFMGEHLKLATWIINCDKKLKVTRRFQLIRPKDGMTLLRAKTVFCCIEISSGKPKRMPSIFAESYGKAIILPR